ncbi:MAG: ferric reductase-like transmembrane domain-containing protein [Zoogloeaceae bacterium]|jgi:predicted ferric reductase|nr:ferric reductase-like transmembrane domain-containing protein [Zoogloeaceae bacterium]
MTRHLKFWLIAPSLGLLGVWAFSVVPELFAAGAPGFWEWRRTLVILTGIFAFGWMSGAMLLSLRLPWLESRLRGLDKLYRLHKWLGIGAGLLAFAHWMTELLPKNMVQAGWIAAPARHGGKGEKSVWMELAQGAGEWMAYLMIALVILALIKRFAYGRFRFTHRLMSLIFLVGVYHALLLLPGELWRQPIGWLVALFALTGGAAAIHALAGRIGRRRRLPATVESWRQRENGVLEITCRAPDWPGHQAGQFLLAAFDEQEGAHPFTIASDWNGDSATLTLAIKPLGDYTRELAATLRSGQRALLEGPYGAFTFNAGAAGGAPQIWVAGGIGVTPFLARLEALAKDGDVKQDIDFFYSVPDADHCPAQLASLCQAAGVRLHCRYTKSEGKQPFSVIQERLRDNASVWFCGPANWGAALGKSLQEAGLDARRYHRELFEFR